MTDLTQPKFFGRRKGRTIHKTKAHLLEAFLPQVSLDTSLSLSKETLFPKPVSKIFLEIGFGDGAHLAAQALKNQDIGYIGVEVFKNGVAHLLSLITNTAKGDVSTMPTLAPERCDNIRIFADDVRLLFPKIPNSFIDRVYLLFPDPWPKKRHAERRFVNPENLKELARILRQGGILRIATDHPVYKAWVLRQMRNCPDFVWTAKTSSDWRDPPADWVETKYQRKAVAEGRTPVFFEYRRV